MKLHMTSKCATISLQLYLGLCRYFGRRLLQVLVSVAVDILGAIELTVDRVEFPLNLSSFKQGKTTRADDSLQSLIYPALHKFASRSNPIPPHVPDHRKATDCVTVEEASALPKYLARGTRGKGIRGRCNREHMTFPTCGVSRNRHLVHFVRPKAVPRICFEEARQDLTLPPSTARPLHLHMFTEKASYTTTRILYRSDTTSPSPNPLPPCYRLVSR